MNEPTPENALDMVDRLVRTAALNPQGFRSPPTGKHHRGHDPKPTGVEKLSHIAKAASLPTRELSAAGKERIAKWNALSEERKAELLRFTNVSA